VEPRPVPTRRLDLQELERPLRPGARMLSDADRAAHLARERGIGAVEPFRALRTRRRMLTYAAVACVVLPVLNVFLTPIGTQALWAQALLAGAVGVWVGASRPTPVQACLGLLAVGLAMLALAGARPGPNYGTLLTLVLYGGLGAVLGQAEALDRADGS
jgi:peptidoglycan/LPS O-acetylase OafA/YrhL